MEDSKRKAFIKQQAIARKKLEGSLPPKMSQANPSTKRKSSEKVDHHPKKPKVVTGSIIGETLATSKLPPKPGPRKGKSLMKGPNPIIEKRLVLFYEDSRYALKQLSSIIKDNDYEDLGNHATKAVGETGLFSLAQVCLSVPFLLFPSYCCLVLTFSFDSFRVVMLKGLMDCCASYEMVMSHLREKVEARETGLRELTAWKEV